MTMALTRGGQCVLREQTTFGEQYKGAQSSVTDRTLREYLISSRARQWSVMDLGCAICCGAGVKMTSARSCLNRAINWREKSRVYRRFRCPSLTKVTVIGRSACCY
ncbi:MAG: hypothetical protein ACI9W2_002657 [Gammaproteobacteria bacterium]|jgi:hypothetical protein